MHIGFDAKRVFKNSTGLGNYSRTLLGGLSQFYPTNQYHLFAEAPSNLFDYGKYRNIELHQPSSYFNRKFAGLWRRSNMVKDIVHKHIDIYHGLSNELPVGLKNTAVKKVVTIHDLIFERYPDTYHLDERYVHRWKMKQACRDADAIIATSNQTKEDLIEFYKVDANKIFTCYQSCDPIFEVRKTAGEKAAVKLKYHLPDHFFLFVSTISKRKNLITICKAMLLLKSKLRIPLVVIGKGKKEKEEVITFMKDHQLDHQIIFLNDFQINGRNNFIENDELPAIYQQATALIYPSIFEGFGIPLLEAMWSETPIIASNTSSLPELAEDAALYFSPFDIEGLADQMLLLSTDKKLAASLKTKGIERTKHFTQQQFASAVMQVYKTIL